MASVFVQCTTEQRASQQADATCHCRVAYRLPDAVCTDSIGDERVAHHPDHS